MGAKTLPGTPVMVNNGRNAMTMIVVAKKDRTPDFARRPHDVHRHRHSREDLCARW
jgi:hypothetical protein